MLIALDQASNYLRRDTTDDDAELTILIQAASAAIIDHLASGEAYLDFVDSDGNALTEDSDGVAEDVPAIVQAATMYLTGWLYRNRDADPEQVFKGGFLPYPILALLGPMRDPVHA